MEKKKIGLPGGPNEYITHVDQIFSVEGYKSDSPDVNNPFNIIDSGNITMDGVDFPVMGTDNLGNSQMMMPGMNYQFPGDQVFEVPMAQNGIELNKKYIDSTFNANMDKRWVQRLYEKNPEFYLEGQTKPSTHFMESGDSMVYPLVVEGDDGNLMFDRKQGRSQGIKFPTDDIAQWFAENYKDGTDVLKEKEHGGGLKIKNEFDELERYTYPSSVFKNKEGEPEQLVMLDDVVVTAKGPITSAKEQMKEFGITNKLKESYVKGKSEKAYNNIIPQAYGDIKTNLDRYRRYEGNLGRDPEALRYYGPKDKRKGLYTIPNRDDAFRLYLGMPQINNSFSVSDYRPGDSEDKSMVYLKPTYFQNPEIRQTLLDNYFSRYDAGIDEKYGLGFQDKRGIGNERGIRKEEYKGDGTPWPNADNALGDFTFDMGEDDKGSYISIYDIWDLNPFSSEGKGSSVNRAGKGILEVFNKMSGKEATSDSEVSELFGAGKPFEVYERIYFDPKTRKLKEMEKGGSTSWMWKGKSYSGTLIPSMENEKNKYARTKNGKIKTLPKAQLGLANKLYKMFKGADNAVDVANTVRKTSNVVDNTLSVKPFLPSDITARRLAGNQLYNIHNYTAKQLDQLLKESRAFLKNTPNSGYENSVEFTDDVLRKIQKLEPGVQKDLKLQEIAERAGRTNGDETGKWISDSYINSPANEQLGHVTTSNNLWDIVFKSNGDMIPYKNSEALYFNQGGKGQLARSRMMAPENQGGAINLIFDNKSLKKSNILGDVSGGEYTISQNVNLKHLFPKAKIRAKDLLLNEAELRGIQLSDDFIKSIDNILDIKKSGGSLPKAQYGEEYAVVPEGGIELDEIVLTGKSKNRKEKDKTRKEALKDMPDYLRFGDDDRVLSFEQQQKLKDLGITDIDSYNEYFGTDYSKENAGNEYLYLNSYKPEYDEMISNIHGATNTAAQNFATFASLFVPAARAPGMVSKVPQAYRYLANSPVGKAAYKYVANPVQKALNYKPFSGPISIGNVIDGGSAAYAAYATPEAYDRFKENPSFSTGLDLGLTAVDLVPFSEILTGGKNIKNLYNKGKNLFTKTSTSPALNTIDASTDPGIRQGLANLNDEVGIVNTTSSQIRASEKFNKNWFNHPDVIKKTEQMLNQPSGVRANMSEIEILQDINMYNTMLDKTPNLPANLQTKITENLKDLRAGLAKRNLEKVQQKGRFTEIFDDTNLNHQDMSFGYDENAGVLGMYKGRTNQASVNLKRIKEKAMDAGSVITHEDLHAITVGKFGYTDEAKDILTSAVGKDQDWWLNKINTAKDQKTREELIDRLEYLARPQEIHARVHELRKAFNLKPGQEISPSKIEAIITKGLKGDTPVSEDFFRLLGDKENFRKIFNKLPAIIPAAVGLGAASQDKNGGESFKAGGEKQIYKVYSDYITGNTQHKNGEKVYDKLNRMHYKDAKQAGMSVPNYIMTYLAGNS